MFGLGCRDLLLISVGGTFCYISPVGSTAYTTIRKPSANTVTHKLVNRLLTLPRKYRKPDDELILLGDLNARVAAIQEISDAEADADLEMFTGTEIVNAGKCLS